MKPEYSSNLELSEPICVVPSGDFCGEGACYDARGGFVYWVDINRFLIHRYCEKTGDTRHWLFDEPVVALALSPDPDRLLAALASRLIWWHPSSDARHAQGFTLPGYPQVRFNDGRADPRGDFWVGSMRNNVLPDGELTEAGGADGILYRIGKGGAVTQLADGIGISNTLCWRADRQMFYFGDSLANILWRFPYDPASGDLGERLVHFSGFERGAPDGSAIDREGYLWNCRFGGGGIARIAPDGQLDRFIPLPVRNLTTCVFGGPDLSWLYVTSATNRRATGDRLAGSLWKIVTNVQGLPENYVQI